MNEEHEELAALSAMRSLDDSDQSAFEIEVARDTELENLTTELEETVAALASVVPAVTPPAKLKIAIMEQVRERAIASSKKKAVTTPSASTRFQPLGWGIAAVLAVGFFWLWTEYSQLTKQVAAMSEVEADALDRLIAVRDERDALEEERAEAARQMAELALQLETLQKNNQLTLQQVSTLTQEISQMRKKDAFAQVQIAMLQSTVDAYKQGVAVVVWDSEKHEGMLKLEKMPPVEAGKDYQLWVVDPKNPTPVNAGIVQVDAQGFAKVDFRPVVDVSEAAKFALSIEREGGVPKNEGPIILIGP